jgi:hypothetical protein
MKALHYRYLVRQVYLNPGSKAVVSDCIQSAIKDVIPVLVGEMQTGVLTNPFIHRLVHDTTQSHIPVLSRCYDCMHIYRQRRLSSLSLVCSWANDTLVAVQIRAGYDVLSK